jgi:peptidoglycan L-alanyl-D-glutamate endopeptidase CwlK
MTFIETVSAIQKKLDIHVDGKAGPDTWGAIHLAIVGRKPAADASLDAIIRAVQKKLGAFVDGSPGPETWGVIYRGVVGKKAPDEVKTIDTPTLASAGKPADSRSEGNIATLHPRVRPYARMLIEKAAAQGIIIKVTSGMRSYAEQAELYAKYQAGGPLAAPPGKSNHNFGLAFDVTIFKGSDDPEKAKTPVWESPNYKVVGALGDDIGLEWGGHWKKVDEPHFQLRPGWAADMSEPDMLAELRKRKDSGKEFYA